VLDTTTPEAMALALQDASLDAMHALGVRGVRFNLVSPVGDAGQALSSRMAILAPRLRARGWHVQWYAHAHQLHEVLALHQRHPVACVLDHLAGMALTVASDDAAWQALAGLADLGAWVKLSGWYRLGVPALAASESTPGLVGALTEQHHIDTYRGLMPNLQRVAAMLGDRLVWGSDWPHTGRPAEAVPPYAATAWPVLAALGPERARAVAEAGARLYA
jgi:predicted TIM-barrel fold metal-dependent hydrolase